MSSLDYDFTSLTIDNISEAIDELDPTGEFKEMAEEFFSYMGLNSNDDVDLKDAFDHLLDRSKEIYNTYGSEKLYENNGDNDAHNEYFYILCLLKGITHLRILNRMA